MQSCGYGVLRDAPDRCRITVKIASTQLELVLPESLEWWRRLYWRFGTPLESVTATTSRLRSSLFGGSCIHDYIVGRMVSPGMGTRLGPAHDELSQVRAWISCVHNILISAATKLGDMRQHSAARRHSVTQHTHQHAEPRRQFTATVKVNIWKVHDCGRQNRRRAKQMRSVSVEGKIAQERRDLEEERGRGESGRRGSPPTTLYFTSFQIQCMAAARHYNVMYYSYYV